MGKPGMPQTRNKRRIGVDAQHRLAKLVAEVGTGEKLCVSLRSTVWTIENATRGGGVREDVAARLETRLRELVP